jgi:hypothetical protein
MAKLLSQTAFVEESFVSVVGQRGRNCMMALGGILKVPENRFTRWRLLFVSGIFGENLEANTTSSGFPWYLLAGRNGGRAN